MKKVLFITVLMFEFLSASSYTLDTAITYALENNKKNKISSLSLEIAKFQYNRAKSAHYPTLDLTLVANRMKNDSMFDVHSSYKADSNTSRAMAFASTLDPAVQAKYSMSAAALQTLFGNGTIPIPEVTIPLDFTTQVAGRDTTQAKLELLYPLYTGGKITSIVKQAQLNKLLAQTAIIRDENDIVFDVKQYFYAYRLANELYSLSNDVYLRMKNLEDLTKQFLEEGDSLNIKKTDYLNMQVTVALISSKVAELEIKRELSKAALRNVMGLKYNDEVEFVYDNKKISYVNLSLEKIIEDAYLNNTDLKKMKIGLNIYGEKIKEAKAAYYPDIALAADVSTGYNSYEFSALNDNSWSVSIVGKLSLFKGFETKNNIKEKVFEKRKLSEQSALVKEGLALLINNEFIKSSYGYKQIQILDNARKIANANRDLNVRAYRVDAVTPKEVIESQLTKAYVEIDYLKYVHDYSLSLAKIEQLVGSQRNK